MSADDYRSYRGLGERYDGLRSGDEEEKARVETERLERLRTSRTKAAAEPVRSRAKEVDQAEVRRGVDRKLARNKITSPDPRAKTAIVILTDNSGSNRDIARSLKRAAPYLHSVVKTLEPNAAVALMFFSDHWDGDRLLQEVDYTMPDEEGATVLKSSIDCIEDAHGGDEAEAIECALHSATKLDFGGIPKEKRHLILVTDQVAHGMGEESDDGCPIQRDWRTSLKEVRETYGSFQVVASGQIPQVFELQKKFIKSDRLQYDLMDLATGRLTHEERCRLVTNAVLFFIARNSGFQGVQLFLMMLFEKWLADPQYGSDTERRAREQIKDFAQYLEESPKKVQELLDQVCPETTA